METNAFIAFIAVPVTVLILLAGVAVYFLTKRFISITNPGEADYDEDLRKELDIADESDFPRERTELGTWPSRPMRFFGKKKAFLPEVKPVQGFPEKGDQIVIPTKPKRLEGSRKIVTFDGFDPCRGMFYYRSSTGDRHQRRESDILGLPA